MILIKFLIDYIIYEKIEEEIINNSYPGEYSYIIELKETIEETEIQINNMNFLSSLSLSALKFEKNKKERIFNKFYFEKDRVKKIKNKEFKNYIYNNELNHNNSLNNLNTSIMASTLLNNSKSNFNNNNNFFCEENDNKKIDDIDVNECLYVDSLQKNYSSNASNININKIKTHRKKLNNIYFKKDFYSFNNENSVGHEEKNSLNTNIQLPSIRSFLNQNNQNMDENEHFEKMVFNPEFLSQKARYILKLEKLKKKNLKKNSKHTHAKNNSNSNNNSNSKINPGMIKTSYSKKTINFLQNNFYKSKINFIPGSTSNKNIHPINYNNINRNINDFNTIKYKTISRNRHMQKNLDEKYKLKVYKYPQNENEELNTNFFGVPESFPGMTLLNFGKSRGGSYSKNIKLIKKKKSLSKLNIQIKDEKVSHKTEIMNKIKETVKNNILRNARRVAFSMYQKGE